MAEDASQISVEDFDRQMMAGYAEPPAAAESAASAAPVVSQPVQVSQAASSAPHAAEASTLAPSVQDNAGDASPAAAVPPPSQAQQPAAAPSAEDVSGLRPDIAKNFRITANDSIEQRALQIRAQDRSLSLSEALNQAYGELGVSNPALNRQAPQANAPQQQVQAEPVVDPVKDIDSRIAALEAEQEKLNPALDAEEYHRLNKQIRALEREQVKLEAQQVASQQLNEIQGQQSLQQIEATLRNEFDVLSDPSHPFTIAYEANRQQIYATATDEQLEDPNLELNLARSLAEKFQKNYGMTVGKQVSRVAAQPQAQQANVTQQPGPAAVAAQSPAAQPRSAAAPLSGSSASAIPVMGVREADPGSAAAALLSSGKGVGEDFDAMLMGSAFQGGNAPAPGRSYSMA